MSAPSKQQQRQQKYREANREKIRAKSRQRYAERRDAGLPTWNTSEAGRAYAAAYRESRRAYNRASEAERARGRVEDKRAHSAAWRESNREYIRAYKAERTRGRAAERMTEWLAEHDCAVAPIPSFPGYLADENGTIYSLLNPGLPRALRYSVGPCGFRTLSARAPDFTRPCVRAGTLTAEAFLGPRPEFSEVRRLNGVTTDDRRENLAYGSGAEVTSDHRARGVREGMSDDDSCPDGLHRYGSMSWLGAWGARFCQSCANVVMSRRAAPQQRGEADRLAVLTARQQREIDRLTALLTELSDTL